jgi:hypothetical protein
MARRQHTQGVLPPTHGILSDASDHGMGRLMDAHFPTTLFRQHKRGDRLFNHAIHGNSPEDNG